MATPRRGLASWPIRRKLVTLVAGPLVLILGAGLFFTAQSVSALRAAQKARDLAGVAQLTNQFVSALNSELARTMRFTATRPAQAEQKAPLAPQKAMLDSRKATDLNLQRMRDGLSKPPGGAWSSAIEARRADVNTVLTRLPFIRRGVDAGNGDHVIRTGYNKVLSATLALTDSLARELSVSAPDGATVDAASTLSALAAATSAASEEIARLGTALKERRLSDNSELGLIELKVTQNTQLNLADSHSTPDQRLLITAIREDDSRIEVFRRTALEAARNVGSVKTQAEADNEAATFAAAAGERVKALDALLTDVTATMRQTADANARNALLQTGLVTGLAVLSLLLASALVTFVARTVTVPMRRLRAGAVDAATVRLPAMVRQIEREGPDAMVPLPPVLPAGTQAGPETIEVAQAVDGLTSEALRLATAQVRLRHALDEAFVSMSRRSQSMVEKQLAIIDELESTEEDPEQLRNLFRLDHLAARMRRYNDNLLVLAGSTLRTRSAAPVPIADVFRAATSEMEQYERVRLQPVNGVAISGPVAGGLVHLLAELLDNAAMYSPPTSPILLAGSLNPDGGLHLEITDSGVGIPASELADLNARLAMPGSIDTQVPSRMGLYVVARLAQRGGFSVRLSPRSQAAGTVAEVDVPAAMVVGRTGQAGQPSQPVRTEQPSQPLAANQPLRAAQPLQALPSAQPLQALQPLQSMQQLQPRQPLQPLQPLPTGKALPPRPGSPGRPGDPGRPPGGDPRTGWEPGRPGQPGQGERPGQGQPGQGQPGQGQPGQGQPGQGERPGQGQPGQGQPGQGRPGQGGQPGRPGAPLPTRSPDASGGMRLDPSLRLPTSSPGGGPATAPRGLQFGSGDADQAAPAGPAPAAPPAPMIPAAFTSRETGRPPGEPGAPAGPKAPGQAGGDTSAPGGAGNGRLPSRRPGAALAANPLASRGSQSPPLMPAPSAPPGAVPPGGRPGAVPPGGQPPERASAPAARAMPPLAPPAPPAPQGPPAQEGPSAPQPQGPHAPVLPRIVAPGVSGPGAPARPAPAGPPSPRFEAPRTGELPRRTRGNALAGTPLAGPPSGPVPLNGAAASVMFGPGAAALDGAEQPGQDTPGSGRPDRNLDVHPDAPPEFTLPTRPAPRRPPIRDGQDSSAEARSAQPRPSDDSSPARSSELAFPELHGSLGPASDDDRPSGPPAVRPPVRPFAQPRPAPARPPYRPGASGAQAGASAATAAAAAARARAEAGGHQPGPGTGLFAATGPATLPGGVIRPSVQVPLTESGQYAGPASAPERGPDRDNGSDRGQAPTEAPRPAPRQPASSLLSSRTPISSPPSIPSPGPGGYVPDDSVGDMIGVPDADIDLATPIFDSISAWFSDDDPAAPPKKPQPRTPERAPEQVKVIDLRDDAPVPALTPSAPAGGRWAALGDQQWMATNARAAAGPSVAGATEAGLPRRRPGANLLPSAAEAAPAAHNVGGRGLTASPSVTPSVQSATGPAATRPDAEAVRGRLGSYQRGLTSARRARHLPGESTNRPTLGESELRTQDAGSRPVDQGGDQ